jgi:hypothetical protein
VKNGCIPEAPSAGHNSQAGALLEVPAAPVPDDPPDVAGDDDVDLAPPGALERVAVAPPADAEPVVEVPVVDPVAAVLVVAAGVD